MNVSKTASLHRERNCSLKLNVLPEWFEISTEKNKVSTLRDLVQNTPTGKIADLEHIPGRTKELLSNWTNFVQKNT